MSRLLADTKCRFCRARGCKLYLKGARCFSAKCPVDKKNTPPGMHGLKRTKKPTDYGLQLRAKQKVRYIYGVLESQLKSYFIKAKSLKGKVGDNMLGLLERRLDNVVYAAGLATSRSRARQLVSHRHVLVNGRPLNVSSYQVVKNDVISLDAVSQKEDPNLNRFDDKDLKIPQWLELDRTQHSVKVLSYPTRDDIPHDVNENLIIEFYSR